MNLKQLPLNPLVSIILPIRNEETFLSLTLERVCSQDYPHELMEILLADGMSTDKTRDIIAGIAQEQKDIPIQFLDNPGQIVPTGFNIALERARGDIIIRVDGHCDIELDYVRRCVELLRETGASNVGGLQIAFSKTWVGRAVALATSSKFGVGNAYFHFQNKAGWVDTVYLGAWPKEVFDQIGGFDEELVRNQDDEFNFRLAQAGGKIWLDPSIRSIYYPRTSLFKLWRQYFQFGFFKIRVIQKRGAVPSWRHLVPAVFVIGLCISLLTGLLTDNFYWASLVIGPYFLINLFASFWTSRRDWSTLPLLPLTFLILHLSYGSGFLWGLWRWRKKWIFNRVRSNHLFD